MEQQEARMSEDPTPLGGRRVARPDVRLPRLEEVLDPAAPEEEGDASHSPRERSGAPERGETSTVYQARPRRIVPALLERLPAARLTGLGCGLLSALALFVFACLDWLLFDASPGAYGGFFLLVSLAASVWVRPYDLVTPPVTLPLAFTLGVVPISADEQGVGGLVVGVFSRLALQVGWLYAGTLLSIVVVAVRKGALVASRRAARRERRQRVDVPDRVRPSVAERRARERMRAERLRRAKASERPPRSSRPDAPRRTERP